MENLKDKRCIPCEGGTKPLIPEAVTRFMGQTPLWSFAGDSKSIFRNFKFRDFKGAMAFVSEVADIAEFEGHHPDIDIRWNKVLLTLSTHAIKGLSENDFILASKIDAIETVGPLA